MAGLGTHGVSIGTLTAEILGVPYLDLARRERPKGGMESVPQLAELPNRCRLGDVVLIWIVIDSLLKPPLRVLRFLPRRYARYGILCPRAVFSSRRPKRILQRIESFFTWRFRNLLIRVFGNEQVEDAKYEQALDEAVAALLAKGCRPVLVGHAAVSGRYFYGSSGTYDRHRKIVCRVAELNGQTYVPADQILDRWDDYVQDRIHPNERGHRKLAKFVERALDGPPNAN